VRRTGSSRYFINKDKIMANNKTAVFGIYHNVNQAERVVERLLTEGFSNDDISVLLPDNQGSKDFAHEKNTKAPEGTTTGVTAGGGIGGTLGLLGGIGVLAIPGVGPFHRSRSDHGRSRRLGRRRRCWRIDWCSGWHGYTRV